MRLIEARLLRDILDGAVNEARPSNPELVALNRLRRAGLVNKDLEPRPTSDVTASLLLDESE